MYRFACIVTIYLPTAVPINQTTTLSVLFLLMFEMPQDKTETFE